jgi:hypothetical protein
MASSSPDHVRDFRNRLPNSFDDLEQAVIEALDAADIAFQNTYDDFPDAQPEFRFAQNVDYLALGNTDNGWYR